VDVLLAFNESGAIFASGRQANDTITFQQNVTGVLSTATVYGGEGDDQIAVNGAFNNAAVSSSTINGNIGEDTLTAGNLAQSFFDGGADDDVLNANGGAAASTIRGSKGNDDINLGGAYTSSLINGNENNDDIDFVAANVVGSVVYGGADADTIDANGASSFTNATINGNKGLDVITVAVGAEADGLTIFGGEGTDTIAAIGLVNGTEAANLYLSGDLGNDSVTAGDGEDTIMGGDGNDTLTAGGGTDLIEGGAGNDFIFGDGGADTIFGGDGNDIITGGGGSNNITGGNGADTYVAGGTDTFIIDEITNSAAAVTGTTVTFDNFDDGAFTTAVDELNIAAVASILNGGRITAADAANIDNIAVTADNFAELKTKLDASNVANASGGGTINAYRVTVTNETADGSIAGSYLWINDNQKTYNQNDLMFEFFNAGQLTAFNATDIITA